MGYTSGRTTTAQDMDGKNVQREVVKKGWLLKRGEYITTWRKRYFVLFSDGGFSGFKTMESVERESGEKQNNFTVEGCQIMTASKPKPFTFIIRGLQLTSVVERMFSVESEPERQAWVEAIEKVKEGLSVHSPAGGAGATNENPLQDYELLKVLGRGTFGKVVLCREKKNQKLCDEDLAEGGDRQSGRGGAHHGGEEGVGEQRTPFHHQFEEVVHNRRSALPGDGVCQRRGALCPPWQGAQVH